jgi:hypothetical protein
MENIYVISGARFLERSHFNDYRGQPVVDLTKSSCFHIPKWLGEIRNIQKLIVDVKSARFALGFEKGFPETIQVEIKNMRCLPDDLPFQQVVGADEFIDSLELTQDGGAGYPLNES